MSPLDFLLIALIVLLFVLALRAHLRRGGCCGGCDRCAENRCASYCERSNKHDP